MNNQPAWQQIAEEKDQEINCLLRRRLRAEGHDVGDTEALLALISDAESVWRD